MAPRVLAMGTATGPRPHRPRVASTASVPPAKAPKKQLLLRMDSPLGWPGLCGPHKPLLTHVQPLGVSAGAPPCPGSSMGTENPRGASHLQTLPFGALQPPVQHSKTSNPFNEASGKSIPLKSLRPWQQLTPDPSSFLLFYLRSFKINNITEGANYFPAESVRECLTSRDSSQLPEWPDCNHSHNVGLLQCPWACPGFLIMSLVQTEACEEIHSVKTGGI